MSAQPVEVIDETDIGSKPPVAHCYCFPCNRGRDVAVSVCGEGRKPVAALRMTWPPGTQVCVICAEMENQACPRCGS